MMKGDEEKKWRRLDGQKEKKEVKG